MPTFEEKVSPLTICREDSCGDPDFSDPGSGRSKFLARGRSGRMLDRP